MDTTHFKNILIAEKTRLESELNNTGVPEVGVPGSWQPTPTDRDTIDSREDVADRLEEYQEQEATEANLEKRLRDVTLALEKIDSGTYGLCEISGEAIEPERLEANPAARTCKAHINEEDNLT